MLLPVCVCVCVHEGVSLYVRQRRCVACPPKEGVYIFFRGGVWPVHQKKGFIYSIEEAVWPGAAESWSFVIQRMAVKLAGLH